MGLDVLDIIKEIHQEKKDKKISPDFATRLEVKNRIMEKLRTDLQQLRDDGVIKVGETLNDLYFELTKKEKQ